MFERGTQTYLPCKLHEVFTCESKARVAVSWVLFMSFVLPKESCSEFDSWHVTVSPAIRNAFELEEITCFVNFSLANFLTNFYIMKKWTSTSFVLLDSFVRFHLILSCILLWFSKHINILLTTFWVPSDWYFRLDGYQDQLRKWLIRYRTRKFSKLCNFLFVISSVTAYRKIFSLEGTLLFS